MRISFMGLMLASAAFPAIASAETAEGNPVAADQSVGVQDIIVTAQRREESLQKVPIAVAAFSSVQLQQRGISSLAGLLSSGSPGLTVVPFAGAENQLVFNIRGISAIDPGIGLNDQGVSVYTDGVPIGRTNGAGIELADLERIEILRGPQGTLFGRNAEGGAVQFIAKRPTGKLDGRVEGELGSYNEQRLFGQLDLPAIGNLAIKIGGLTDRHDGYTKNAPLGHLDSLSAADHHDFGYKNQQAFRIAAEWKPVDGVKAYYAYDWSDLQFTNTYQQRYGGRVGVTPLFAFGCTGTGDPAYCSDIPGNSFTGTQLPETGIPKVSALPEYLPANRTKIQGHTLILSWQAAPHLELKSIGGYRQVDETSLNNLGTSTGFLQFVPTSLWASSDPGTLAAVGAFVANAEVHQRQYSQELQAIGEIGRLKYTVGLFYYHEDLRDIRANGLGTAYLTNGSSDTVTPVTTGEFFPFGTGLQQYDAYANSFAIYGQAVYTPPILDDRLKLIVGLRYTDDKKVFHRVMFGGAPDDTLAPIFQNSRLDPAITISFQASPDVSIYAKYSTAYRAGGVGVRNALALNTYGAEVNSSFEAGLKSELLNRRVRFNIAGFYSRINGFQTSEGNDSTNPASTDTVNLTAPVKFYGIETELTVVPMANVTLSMNYAYLGIDAPATVSDTLGTYPLHIPNAPHNQLSLNADYQIPLDWATVTLHGDYSLTSDYVSNPVEFPGVAFPQQSQHQINARIGLKDIKYNGVKFSVTGYVKNLTNSHDFEYGYNIREGDPNGPTNGGIGVATAPRTFGVQLRADF